MALFNYAAKEITLKIVYYGPGLCGKTTNLQRLHANMSPDKRTKLLSLSTESDRTLFFDFMPIALGKIKDFNIKFQLYTVPGQVRYNATRKLVLKGADAIVFVADSQIAMKEANIESLHNMKENLLANNLNPDDIPLVIQYNKRDLDDTLPIEVLNDDLNPTGDRIIEAAAIDGTGVEETFKFVTQRLLKHISVKHNVQIEVPEEEPETASGLKVTTSVSDLSMADESVVSISVKDKGTDELGKQKDSLSESEIEENLMKTSIPDAKSQEVDPSAWPSPASAPTPKVSVQGSESSDGDFFDQLPTAQELYDESDEKHSGAVAAEASARSSEHVGNQELLMQILQELRESRKQQDSILEALKELGNAFSRYNS